MQVALSVSWVALVLSFCVSTSFGSAAPADRFIPNKYIVELHSSAESLGKRANMGRSVHEELYHTMRKRSIPVDPVLEFNQPDVMLGASLNLRLAEDVARISEIPGVKAIRPVLRIPRPQTVDDLSARSDLPLASEPFSTHVMTGVDRLHAQGYMGQGIKIGVIDSGVDYNHPALGGGIGPGHKIIGGHDFCGDQYTSLNEPIADDDPLDTCSGHGTLIAGVIGADPENKFGLIGVAPKASISAYRIFGCEGDTGEDLILAALQRAYEDGMDVLSLSLGSVEGWASSTVAVAASHIAEAGRVVITAAGNDGAHGPWSSANVASGLNVISVGSVNSVLIPAHNATVVGVDHAPIPYLQPLPFNATGDLPIYVSSMTLHPTDGDCQSPGSMPDLTGHVVVLRKSHCVGLEMKHASDKGGKYFFIFSSDDLYLESMEGNGLIAMIRRADGNFLVEKFAAGTPVKLNFPSREGLDVNIRSELGGLVSWFSTVGPTYDMHLTPSLTAPGGNILSTLPMALGGYGVRSATSMAAPFVAGASALILQAKGKGIATSMRDLLQSTAISVASSATEKSLLQTVSKQGAGLLRIDHAMNTKTIVRPTQLMLNDTAHFNSTHNITIKNSGSKPLTYKLTHVAAGTALTMQPNSIFPSTYPLELVNAAANVEINPSSLTLSPGTSAGVVLTFKAPQNVDKSRLPVFSGFIKISGDKEVLQVAYLGAIGDLKKQTVLANIDRSGQFENVKLPVMVDSDGHPVNSQNMSHYSMKERNLPGVAFRLAFGSPLIHFELCDKSIDQADVSKAGDIPTVGLLEEARYMPRNFAIDDHLTLSFAGRFANLTQVPDGQYRFLLRALKVTGDPNKASDYERWLSPPFTFSSAGP